MTSISSTPDNARRERVLAAALEVFGRYGFRKASMDEIARSADISRQGLYLHFANKDALFRAAVRQELDTALGDASRCLSEEGGRRFPKNAARSAPSNMRSLCRACLVAAASRGRSVRWGDGIRTGAPITRCSRVAAGSRSDCSTR